MNGMRVRPSGGEVTALAVLVLAFVAATVWVVQVPMILLHDEAVFALQAERWFAEGAGVGVGEHRAPLLSLLGWPAFALSRQEWVFRAVGIVSGVVGVVAVWWLGRRVAGVAAGLLAAAGFAFLPPVVDAAALYMTDLPAAAMLVVAVAGLHHDLVVRPGRGERMGPGVAVAAVATAASLYLRYGSALPVVLIWGTAALLWWPRLREQPRRAAAGVGLLAALLVPMAVRGIVDLGVPWGHILYTTEAGQAERPAVLTSFDLAQRLVGTAGAVVALVAVAVVAVALLGRYLSGRSGDDLRTALLLVVPAVLTAVVLGFVAYLHPRFLFLPLALLSIPAATGVVAVGERLRVRGAPTGRLARGALVVALVVYAAGSTVAMRQWREARDAERIVLERAATAVDAETDGRCSVLTSYNPVITWYTDCAGYPFTVRTAPPAEHRLLLLIEGGKHQPTGRELDRLLACASDLVAEVPAGPGRFGAATLHRLEPGCPWNARPPIASLRADHREARWPHS